MNEAFAQLLMDFPQLRIEVQFNEGTNAFDFVLRYVYPETMDEFKQSFSVDLKTFGPMGMLGIIGMLKKLVRELQQKSL